MQKVINENKPKPFIQWTGGKQKLTSQIIQHLPNNLNKLSDITYIEPFIGGGAMLFYMLSHYRNIKQAIISDKNEKLINLYNNIKFYPTNLIAELQKLQDKYYSYNSLDEKKEMYLEIRDKFNNDSISKCIQAAYFMFLNKTCFNALYRVNNKNKFNVPFGKHIKPLICDEATILTDSKLLNKVLILNENYSETLDYATENTLFYLDPPYRPLNASQKLNQYTKDSFNDESQMLLKEFCDEITKRKYSFIESNSDGYSYNGDAFFEDLYKDYSIDRVFAARSINSDATKRGKIAELLITNY